MADTPVGQPAQALLPEGEGQKIAIIAVAKKLLKIIWHLLMTGEKYVDRHHVKKTILRSKKETLKLALEDAIPLLRQAGYVITGPG